ncbi:tail fiber domain-containing protein [Cupriavidus sp. 30B13]|uniref:tail fiber domain-containing protein n=1 Tax=Cupriavidus sp. 30B13 TaxID=3384241 RepID=UPI003B91B2E8
MTSVTFTPDVGGDSVTIDDSDNPSTGLANGGHRTRFLIALQQFLKVTGWVKTTAQTVLGYRDAAAVSAASAQTFAAAAQAAVGAPSYAGKPGYVFTVNAGASGVQWSQDLGLRDLVVNRNATFAGGLEVVGSYPGLAFRETDQSGAAGLFRLLADAGAWRLDRNTAAAKDYSSLVTEYQVNAAGRHLFGGVADDGLSKYQFGGNVWVAGSLFATVNVGWTSDARLKADLAPIETALEKVTRMRGLTYVRSDIENSRRYVGVLAQELQEILPEAVYEGANGYLAVDYGALTPVLIEAVKALLTRVEQLERGGA